MSESKELQEEELEALKCIFGEDPFVKLEKEYISFTKEVGVTEPIYFFINEEKWILIDGIIRTSLNIWIPTDYPLESPPILSSVSPEWLPKSLVDKIENDLMNIWETNPNQIVLFNWWQYFSELEIFEELAKAPFEAQIDVEKLKRYYTFFHNNDYKHIEEEEVKEINEEVEENGKKEDVNRNNRPIDQLTLLLNEIFSDVFIEQFVPSFEESIHTCEICMDDYLGTDMTILDPCEHFYCTSCLTDFITINIQEGAVNAIKCPHSGCQLVISSFIVWQLTPDLYSKYDRLLLVAALNTMQDLTYCPRKGCSLPIVIPKNRKEATCPSCNFHFCLICFGVYHGTTRCPLYLSENEQEAESIKYAKQVTRKCPNCFTPIEKNGGCSHMYCTNCYTHFDWNDSIRFESPTPPPKPKSIAIKRTQPQPRPNIRPTFQPTPPTKNLTKNSTYSKPCPRCHLRQAKKNSTYDQMYCMNCQAGFCFFCGSHHSATHFSRGMCLLRSS